MLKTPRGLTSKEPQAWSVVLFRLGGVAMAIKAEEVGGVWPWEPPVSIPSGTKFVTGVLRRAEEILTVFDLAARLGRRLAGTRLLCLIVKHARGPLAICIDETIPTLKTVDAGGIRAAASTGAGDDLRLLGLWRVEDEDVPIYSLAHLEVAWQEAAAPS